MPRTIGIYEITPGENGNIAAYWADPGTVEPADLLDSTGPGDGPECLADREIWELFRVLCRRDVVVQQVCYGRPEQDVDVFIPYPHTEDMQALDRLLGLLGLPFTRPAGPARTIPFPTPKEKDAFVRFFLGTLVKARLAGYGEADRV